MKTGRFLLLIVFSLVLSNISFGERQLEETEVRQILQELTNNAKRTWITAGSIDAIHEEYKPAKTTDSKEINLQINQQIQEYQNNLNNTSSASNIQKMVLDAIPFNTRYQLSNEYSMTSFVTIKYDGEKYYKEINVDSRTDSIKPDKTLAENFMTNDFNLDWNGRRIFAWDGQNHTVYSPGNHAFVDSRSKPREIVNGPLAAGVVPWGHGIYTYENLAEAEATATEDIIDGQVQVTLTLNNLNGIFMRFVLDAGKSYALLSHSMEIDETVFNSGYDNYVKVNDNWVPTTILLEKYNVITNKLLKRDLWNFTSINGDTPAADSFEVEFDEDTIVEFASDITNKPAMYHNNLDADTDELLAERLTYAANQGTQAQNCATAALKYALGQLGTETTDSQLAELVADSTGDTSLLEMKQFAQNLGLYCQAVTADLDTLKNLDNCQIILHIPGKDHFVVLESIDDKYVRVIDLANDKFYYQTDINFFGMDWTEGVALLISNNSIAGDFTNINDEDLSGITGASGYSCTRLLQDESRVHCVMMSGLCDTSYIFYELRKGCEESASGSCSTTKLPRVHISPCLNYPLDPLVCIPDEDDETIYYMRACL